MAEATNRKSYKHAEKQFIEESHVNRVFQTAKENGKVICTECYAHDGSARFYSSTGVEIHYRHAHKRCAFNPENSAKLFSELHFNESKLFINQLSAFRMENSSGLALFKEYNVRAEHLETHIYATCKQEAAKLVGLVLSHGNFVSPSFANGYPLEVVKVCDASDFVEKFFVWKASSKIYVESVYYREVSVLLANHVFILFSQDHIIKNCLLY